jgi:hypothetical protein
VVETIEEIISIIKTKGHAVVTHIGTYKRIKFSLNDDTWISELGNKIAINNERTQAISLDDVLFNQNIEALWTKYISYNDGEKPY